MLSAELAGYGRAKYPTSISQESGAAKVNHSKKIVRKPFLCLALFSMLFATPVGATQVWHSGKITQIYPMGNGDVVLIFDTDSPSCTSNANTDYYYIRVGEGNVTQDGLENMLAIALTAATADLAVTINFDDATSSCFVNRLLAIFSSP